MSSVIIIGGGAAGMAAAIAAATCGDRVLILERMDRVGRKILATGNGRCNLMNTGDGRYPGGSELARVVLSRCGAEEQTRFWQHLGLRMREEDGGRVYPVSGMASTVLDCLRSALEELRVETVTGAHVTAITRGKRGWTVTAGEYVFRADRVIVAGGGCAQPKLGSDGSACDLLRSAGHRIVPVKPALSQVITDTAAIRGLSGVRIRTSVRITQGTRVKHAEQGELLFADYGVTGVCVMQCARFAAPGDTLHIDLVRAMGFADADAFRKEMHRRRRMWPGRGMAELLTGLCVPRLAQTAFAAADLTGVQRSRCGDLTPAQIDRLAQRCSDFSLTVRGVKGFDSAQVTAGGAATEEFAPDTLASLTAPGLHAAGEVLDVDGDCGGFNLMFAFGSGILAGLNGRCAPW